MHNDEVTYSNRGPSAAATVAVAQQRLHASPYHVLRDVQCELRDDSLVLRGHVSSFYLKQLAQEMVRKVDGVRGVVNTLEVGDRPQMPLANGTCHVRSEGSQGSTEASHGRADTDRG